jgi:hypothetical protein
LAMTGTGAIVEGSLMVSFLMGLPQDKRSKGWNVRRKLSDGWNDEGTRDRCEDGDQRPRLWSWDGRTARAKPNNDVQRIGASLLEGFL